MSGVLADRRYAAAHTSHHHLASRDRVFFAERVPRVAFKSNFGSDVANDAINRGERSSDDEETLGYPVKLDKGP